MHAKALLPGPSLFADSTYFTNKIAIYEIGFYRGNAAFKKKWRKSLKMPYAAFYLMLQTPTW